MAGPAVNDDGQLSFDADAMRRVRELAELERQAHARTGDPFTSHEAARSLEPDKLRDSQAAVYSVLMTLGPANHVALIELYNRFRVQANWPAQSDSGIRSRCNELVRGGLVEPSGELVLLESGRRSIVWRVKVAGSDGSVTANGNGEPLEPSE